MMCRLRDWLGAADNAIKHHFTARGYRHRLDPMIDFRLLSASSLASAFRSK